MTRSAIGDLPTQQLLTDRDWHSLLTSANSPCFYSAIAELKKYFRPEFINRIDDVLIVESLTREQIRSIVDIQVKQLTDRLEQKNISVTVSPKARDWLAENGYDPTYGARPMKRLLQLESLDIVSLPN